MAAGTRGFASPWRHAPVAHTYKVNSEFVPHTVMMHYLLIGTTDGVRRKRPCGRLKTSDPRRLGKSFFLAPRHDTCA